jgi:PAS domain S-box-containing protein
MGMTTKVGFRLNLSHLRAPLAIVSLGLLSAFFLFLVNRNIEINHCLTVRADLLMDTSKNISHAHVELSHYMGGMGGMGGDRRADRGLIKAYFSESLGLMDEFIDGGSCEAGCLLETLEEDPMRLEAEGLKGKLEDMKGFAVMALDDPAGQAGKIAYKRLDKNYPVFMAEIESLEDRIEAMLAQSNHDSRALMASGAAVWFAVILISAILLWKFDVRSARAGEAVLQSERKYKNLFESASDAIFVLDMKGNLIDFNIAFHAQLGYTRDELLSMHISQIHPPELSDKFSECAPLVMDKGMAVFESAHVRKDGTVMPVEVNARLVEHDEQQAFFTIARDITERKKVEAALRESQQLVDTIIEATPT